MCARPSPQLWEVGPGDKAIPSAHAQEGYGTWFVIRSFVHSFCPLIYRDHRSLFKLGKGMNRLSATMACNVTRGFC